MLMTLPRRLGPAALALAFLGACAAPPEIVRSANDPVLVLENFFAGRTQGSGAFVNSWTGSERRFDVTIEGTWDGRVLTLVEDFAFADGVRERKIWRLERTGPGSFTGQRDDSVGPARVFTDNGMVRLEYSLLLGGWTVDLADVLALRPDGSLLNLATVGKWGLRVGRIELVLRRAAS